MSNLEILYKKQFKNGTFVCANKLPSFDLLKVKQIHSAEVISSDKLKNQKECEGDGITDTSSDFCLGIQTADCLPILILGNKGVSLIHAGWRGLYKQILFHPEIKKISPYYAFIGPHISQNNYQVGEEFKGYFKNSRSLKTTGTGLLFSQELEAKRQLTEAFGQINIESADVCTYENLSFHSFRRTREKGRNWNIWIPHSLSDKLELIN